MNQPIREEFHLTARQASTIALLARSLGISESETLDLALDMICEDVLERVPPLLDRPIAYADTKMLAPSQQASPESAANVERYEPSDLWKRVSEKARDGYFIELLGGDGGKKFDREKEYAERLDPLSH